MADKEHDRQNPFWTPEKVEKQDKAQPQREQDFEEATELMGGNAPIYYCI